MVNYATQALLEMFLVCFILPFHVHACVVLFSHDELWECACTGPKSVLRTISILSIFNCCFLLIASVAVLAIDPKYWIDDLFIAVIPMLFLWMEWFGIHLLSKLGEYTRG